MSELEDLCEALTAAVLPLPRLTERLHQRSIRLRALGAELLQARAGIRCRCGPDVSSAIRSLHAAADALGSSGQALSEANQQARSYIARTVGGSLTLSIEDRIALVDITGTGHSKLNSALDGNVDQLPAVADRVAAVMHLLEKFPAHEGTVYRGSSRDLTEEEIARYEPGETIVEDRFLHSSLSATIADERFHGNVLWIIDSKHGHMIGSNSIHNDEEEVMFDAFSRFEVLAKQKVDGANQWLVLMREV